MRVKITVEFKGREIKHPENGIALIADVIDATEILIKLTNIPEPKLNGNRMSIILYPRSKNENL